MARFRDPSGTVATVAFGGANATALASGVYAFEHLLDSYGDWHVRIEGLGSNQAVEQFGIYVQPPNIP